MKVVAIVPIKLNNERLHNKNLKKFSNGKSLIEQALEKFRNVNEIDVIYVFCSDEKIKHFLPDHVQFLRRSPSLDSNNTKSNDILREFTSIIDADIYILYHVTSPLIKMDSILRGLKSLEGKKYDSAFSVLELKSFLWFTQSQKNYYLNGAPNTSWQEGYNVNYKIKNIPRTQDLESVFMETTGLYIFKKEVVKEEGNRIGNFPLFIKVSKVEALDIDELEDFYITDAVISKLDILKGIK